MKTESLNIKTSSEPTTAHVSMPAETTENTKIVILIHEWWGLNEHIKDVAGRYAKEGFIAIAPDLYRGSLASDPEEASKLMADLAIEDGVDTIKNTISVTTEKFGKKHVGISGYCMGGTYSLRAACELKGISAAAPFYGDIPPENILKDLKVPVVFFSGLKDAWINPEKVAELTDAAAKYDLPVESISYDADHAFTNNTRPEVYDEAAAKDSWAKVISFFNDKL